MLSLPSIWCLFEASSPSMRSPNSQGCRGSVSGYPRVEELVRPSLAESRWQFSPSSSPISRQLSVHVVIGAELPSTMSRYGLVYLTRARSDLYVFECSEGPMPGIVPACLDHVDTLRLALPYPRVQRIGALDLADDHWRTFRRSPKPPGHLLIFHTLEINVVYESDRKGSAYTRKSCRSLMYYSIPQTLQPPN